MSPICAAKLGRHGHQGSSRSTEPKTRVVYEGQRIHADEELVRPTLSGGSHWRGGGGGSSVATICHDSLGNSPRLHERARFATQLRSHLVVTLLRLSETTPRSARLRLLWECGESCQPASSGHKITRPGFCDRRQVLFCRHPGLRPGYVALVPRRPPLGVYASREAVGEQHARTARRAPVPSVCGATRSSVARGPVSDPRPRAGRLP